MATLKYDEWIEIQDTSTIMTRIRGTNPLTANGREVDMTSRFKVENKAPERNQFWLSGGGSDEGEYTETTGEGGQILLSAEKAGLIVPIRETSIADISADVLRSNVTEIGVGALKNDLRSVFCADRNQVGTKATIPATGEPQVDVPFNSVNNVLVYGRDLQGTGNQDGRNGNLIRIPKTRALEYDDFNLLQGYVEQSDFVEEDNMLWICDWGIKHLIQDIKDDNGNPIMSTTERGAQRTILDAPVWFVPGFTMAPTVYKPLHYYYGTGAPANAMGKVGDFYLNTAIGSNLNLANRIYRKTGAAAWTALTVDNSDTPSGQLEVTNTAGLSGGDDDARVGAYRYSTNSGVFGIKVSLNGVRTATRSNQLGIWYGNPRHLIWSFRQNPEFMITRANAKDKKDTLYIKYRKRLAFQVGFPEAMAMAFVESDHATGHAGGGNPLQRFGGGEHINRRYGSNVSLLEEPAPYDISEDDDGGGEDDDEFDLDD